MEGMLRGSNRRWTDFGPAVLYMLPALALIAAFTYIPDTTQPYSISFYDQSYGNNIGKISPISC